LLFLTQRFLLYISPLIVRFTCAATDFMVNLPTNSPRGLLLTPLCRRLLSLILLLMLNHAFAACDSVVLHMPDDHNHVLTLEHGQHQYQADTDHNHDDDNAAEPHAHVLCFVGYQAQQRVEPVPVAQPEAAASFFIGLNYRPLLPPPTV